MEITSVSTLMICVISSAFICLFAIYSWHIFLGKKFNIRNYKIYLALLIGVLFCTLINLFLPSSMKIIMTIILYGILSYFLFCRDVVKSLVMSIISQLIAFVCECALAIIVLLFVGNNMENLFDNIICLIIVNMGVPILAFLTLKTPYPLRLYNYLVKTFNNMKQSNLIMYFVITALLMTLFLVMTYMNLPSTIVLICNTFLTIFYIIIIVRLANIQENFKIVNNKYETSLTSLKEYEDIMDKYKIANHENKNQLLTIRNMIKAKDKTTVDYIENLVEDKIKDNEEIFYKTSKIPEGGLRATIYSKLCKMDEFNIDYNLDIANDVRAVDLITIGEDVTLDVCKVIGVFLDNAIEEVNKLETKEIDIALFIMDNELCIDVSNNFEGELDIDKIDAAKYTTKGDGHGYGLSLVKKIIKNNKLLGNERRVDNNIFTQRLKIKM